MHSHLVIHSIVNIKEAYLDVISGDQTKSIKTEM
jgi:hypothetical protein